MRKSQMGLRRSSIAAADVSAHSTPTTKSPPAVKSPVTQVTIPWIASCVILMLIVSTVSHAANIPSSVTQGYTYSVDDRVYATTTLKVEAMTYAASTAGNGTAVFEAHSTLFNAGLTIECSAPTAWTHNTSLVVRIINGYTTPGIILSAFVLIAISDPLRLGSIIEILGGKYSFKTNFLSASLVSLFDHSILNISGITLVLNDTTYSATYSPTIFQYGGASQISDGSVVSFSGNDISFERIQVGGYLYLAILTASQLRVRNGGNFIIRGNSVNITDCQFNGVPYVRFMYNGNGFINMRDRGSTFAISENSLKITRSVFFSVLNVDFAYWTNVNEVSLTDGGTLLVHENYVMYDTVQVTGACYFTGLYFSMAPVSITPEIYIHNGSSMIVSTLLVTAINCTFRSSSAWLVKSLYLDTTNTTVSSSSSLEIRGTHFRVVNSTFLGSWAHTITFLQGRVTVSGQQQPLRIHQTRNQRHSNVSGF